MGVVDGKGRVEGGKEDRGTSTSAIGVIEEVASGAFVADALIGGGKGNSADEAIGSKGTRIEGFEKPCIIFQLDEIRCWSEVGDAIHIGGGVEYRVKSEDVSTQAPGEDVVARSTIKDVLGSIASDRIVEAVTCSINGACSRQQEGGFIPGQASGCGR